MIIFTNENIIFSKKFLKEFLKLEKIMQINIKKQFQLFFSAAKNPNIKQLKNYKFAEYRLKIGNYRLLFSELEPNKYIFLRVRHRQDLY
jgi:mRNA-degrading endonuclease RelE of RelBE toxin-antitoxin system